MANRINITIEAQDNSAKGFRSVTRSMDMAAESASSFKQSIGRIRDVALGVYLPQLAGQILDVGGAIFTAAGDFQQGMSVFQQVSGATVAEMEMVRQTARALGNDITLPGVSAKTAADAMIELSKAGLSVNDTLAASKGVLSLAKAGQIETAQAAEIAANALLAFGLQGTEAVRVADLLAAAANASSSDVAGMGLSLAQVSALAAQTKRPIEDVVTQIALLANSGIKGSDAGTSLKAMLLALVSPSSTAAKAMNGLGIQVYDAEGKLKDTKTIIGQFTEALKDKTDAQRDSALADIFGSDAVRAASILVRGGADAYDKMAVSVGKAGAAQELAAAYTKGLKGNIEGIKSALETAGLKIGEKFLPVLERVTGVIAREVEPSFNSMAAVAKRVFKFLEPAIRDLSSAVTGSLIPGFQAAARSDFVKMLGGALVTAAYAAIRVVEGVTRVVGSFLNTIQGSSGLLIGVVAALATYKAGMFAVGTVTALTTTYTVAYHGVLVTARGSTLALAGAMGVLNAVMKLNPFVLVASLVIGLVTAYIALTGTTDGAKSASERLDTAQDNLKVSTDALKFAQDSLRGALLSQEGAALAVEQATARYNEVLKNNAADSLPARQAAYDLKQAEENLARANQEVTTKTDEKKRKEQEAADAKQAVIDAEKAKAREIYGTRDAVDSQSRSVDMLKSNLNLLNGQKFSYSIEEIKSSHVPTPMKNAGYQPPKKALGSIYAPGGRTLVGEHGPELVDLPRGSQVTQAYRTRNEMMNSGDNVTIQIFGNIVNETPEAANAFFDRLDKASRLSRFGMAGGVAA